MGQQAGLGRSVGGTSSKAVGEMEPALRLTPISHFEDQ